MRLKPCALCYLSVISGTDTRWGFCLCVRQKAAAAADSCGRGVTWQQRTHTAATSPRGAKQRAETPSRPRPDTPPLDKKPGNGNIKQRQKLNLATSHCQTNNAKLHICQQKLKKIYCAAGFVHLYHKTSHTQRFHYRARCTITVVSCLQNFSRAGIAYVLYSTSHIQEETITSSVVLSSVKPTITKWSVNTVVAQVCSMQ